MFKGNLKSSDYYLIFDESEKYNVKYFLDTTKDSNHKSWKTVNSNKIYLNNEINFYGDSDAVVFIHIDKPKTKAVLVSLPKNFDRNNLQYDYFRTNECEFVLKAWY